MPNPKQTKAGYTSETRRLSKAETSAKLLAAGEKLFRERGYADAAMEDICSEVGVTRGALYHNFGGKEALFEAVVRRLLYELGDHLLDHPADDGDRLDAFLSVCGEYLRAATDPALRRIVFQEGPAVLGERFRRLDAEHTIGPMAEELQGLMDEGLLARSSPMALAVMLNGALVDAAVWIATQTDDSLGVEDAVAALQTLLRPEKTRRSQSK
ncbi:MAG: TetR/AcrR family transcriptional regulator [Planctomycetota bacterium]